MSDLIKDAKKAFGALDLISRQDVLNALEWKWAGKSAIDAIKNLPSAYQWIPCTERLPEIHERVLLCTDTYTAEGYLRDTGNWTLSRWQIFVDSDSVRAWMPLIEPWKREEA